MRTLNIAYLLTAACLLLATVNIHAQGSTSLTTLRIDPASAMGGTASEVFNEVKYIPLETTRESLFGDVNELNVTDQYFIIYDRDTDCILLFFKNGKFHCKLQGSVINTNLAHSVINKERKQIVLHKWKKNTLYYLYYDFNGKKLKEEAAGSKNIFFHSFPGNKVVYHNYSVDERWPDSLNYELIYTIKNKVTATFFPYNMKKAPLPSREASAPDHEPFYESGNNSTIFFCRPYDYSIYRLTPDTVQKAFSCVFPLVNTLPDDFTTNASYIGKRFMHLETYPQQISDIAYTYQIGNNLFFRLGRKAFDRNQSFIYNLQSNNLLSLGRITPDSLSCFLPIMDEGVEFMVKNFLACDGNYLYTSYSSLTMFQAHLNTAGRNAQFSDELKKYFATGNKKQNPVIVQLKPKENL
ncbi:6-bladed beta-propeller [Niastella caeni]|uniref:6-bladed beta-propeller n=1 Tax=Niastella caeni TaxID=2569763 RepID=A0A4S8I031_9BACT|nr:6-bladed beta-propeller [Niastella caeni]THU41215.1 6-bladed beta-propeller [Niastella caeni]